MQEYIAKVNITTGGKRFEAGKAYSAEEIKGLNFNNFLFVGMETPEKKMVIANKKQVVKATKKPKPRGRPKRK